MLSWQRSVTGLPLDRYRSRSTETGTSPESVPRSVRSLVQIVTTIDEYIQCLKTYFFRYSHYSLQCQSSCCKQHRHFLSVRCPCNVYWCVMVPYKLSYIIVIVIIIKQQLMRLPLHLRDWHHVWRMVTEEGWVEHCPVDCFHLPPQTDSGSELQLRLRTSHRLCHLTWATSLTYR